MNDRLLRGALLVVSLAGIGLASYLTYVHYQPDALVCTAGGGCEKVQESSYAEFLGIPVAVLGLAAWITAFVLIVVDTPLARQLTAAVGVSALAFAGYLVALQLFVIDAICVWCVVNDLVLVPLLAALSLIRLRGDEGEAEAGG